MATKFYFPVNTSADVEPLVTTDGNLAQVYVPGKTFGEASPFPGTLQFRKLVKTKDTDGPTFGDVRTILDEEPYSSYGYSEVVDRVYVSDPILGSITITGDIELAIPIATGPVYISDFEIGIEAIVRIVSRDGQHVRGEFGFYLHDNPNGVVFLYSDARTRTITYTDVDPIACEPGDRIVVILVLCLHAGAAPFDGQIEYGNTGTASITDDVNNQIGLIQFSQTILFETDFAPIEIRPILRGNGSLTAEINSEPILKYNVYIATAQEGPWTLVTPIPLNDIPQGNHFKIEGLTNGQLYYIMVIAGKYDTHGNFIGICGQPIITSSSSGATGPSNPNIIAAKPNILAGSNTHSIGFKVTIIAGSP